jgi:receptor expression-enhancing protein 5/6
MDARTASIESLRRVRDQTTALKDQYFPGINTAIANARVVGPRIDSVAVWLGISNTFLVLYLGVALAVLATWALDTDTLCNIAGIYPALQTFKARETNDLEQWLSYWMIFVSINVLQRNTYAFAWIPMFDGFKLGFLLFCFLPHTRGAEFVYHAFFKQYLRFLPLDDVGAGGGGATAFAAVGGPLPSGRTGRAPASDDAAGGVLGGGAMTAAPRLKSQ